MINRKLFLTDVICLPYYTSRYDAGSYLKKFISIDIIKVHVIAMTHARGTYNRAS